MQADAMSCALKTIFTVDSSADCAADGSINKVASKKIFIAV